MGFDPRDYGPQPRMRWDESEKEFRRRENAWYMKRYEEYWKKRQRELAGRNFLGHLINGILMSIQQSRPSIDSWKKMDEEERLKTVKDIFSKAEKGCKQLSERKEIPSKVREALKRGADALGKANKTLDLAEKAMDLYDAAQKLQLFFESNPLEDQAKFAKRAGGALVGVGQILKLSSFMPLQEAGKALMNAGSFFEDLSHGVGVGPTDERLRRMRRQYPIDYKDVYNPDR